MKRLPIGIQTFSEIRNNGFLYVDKTARIARLIGRGKYYFLSRPRRFGKSLLLSTVKEIFSGNRELFAGLQIDGQWDWQVRHPVIHIGFSSLGYKTLGLERALEICLDEQAAIHGIELVSSTYDRKFRELIQSLQAAKGQVVILIDEYDKPLIDYLGSEIGQAIAHQQVLKGFYAVIKDADPHIRFLLITGVSKFSKVSLFSDLNNLHDLTLDTDFSDLLGYTQEELEEYFPPYYAKAIQKNDLEGEATLLEKVRNGYNGYSWDGKTFVYNPFSTLSFFQTGDFRNYWFETGTPSFLLQLMKQENFYHLDRLKVNESSFSAYDIENIRLLPLLFQTGYLTIKERGSIRYILDYPNKEVRESMHQYILGELMHEDPAFTTNAVLDLYDALADNDLPELIDQIKALFARIPYEIFIANQEAYYHSLLYIAFQFLGIYTPVEVRTNRGRIDAVIHTPETIFLIEFKLDEPAAAAMTQIHERKYYEQFLTSAKEICLLGISFSSREKSVAEWVSERIAPRHRPPRTP